MKLFANIYTQLATDVLAFDLGMPHWKVNEIEKFQYQLSAKHVNLTLEGNNELLFFGELELSLEEIDHWVAGLDKLPINFTLDLHGDEARLIRRYCQ